MDKKFEAISRELGTIDATLRSLDEKICGFMGQVIRQNEQIDKQHEQIWARIGNHSDKLHKHNGLIKWIIGVGTGFGAFLGGITFWKH